MTQQQIANEIQSVTQIIMSQMAERERKFLLTLPPELRQVMQYEHDTMIIELNQEIF
jgi:hypothetical protein